MNRYYVLSEPAEVTILETELDLAGIVRVLSCNTPDVQVKHAAPTLSERQREILLELASGRPIKQIASRLGLTRPGVEFHIKALRRKLKARTRTDILRRAAEMHLLRTE